MRILIASGGSGGHIFPAVSVARELSGHNGVEIIFAASKRRLDRKILDGTPYKKIYLSANPMPHKFGFGTFVFLTKLILGAFEAMYALIRFRPDVVLGFGGYTAGTILFLAPLVRAKTIIHEQNVVPGRTNRLLGGFVNKIAVSFPETEKYFKNKNVILTGNPTREESLKECRAWAMRKYGLDAKKFTILVMGGSQGARSLNKLISESLMRLSPQAKEKFQVVHITGTKDFNKFKDFYPKNGISGRAFEFVERINEAYSACDLAVSRAGAAAIFELAAFGRPMVLIPYPGKKNNQRFNAMLLADRGAAIYRDESGLEAGELGDLIIELKNNPGKTRELSENAKNLCRRDGAKKLAELVWGQISSSHEERPHHE